MTAFNVNGLNLTVDVAVGDKVQRTTAAGYGANIRQGNYAIVTEVRGARYSHNEDVGGVYRPVYIPEVKLKDNYGTYFPNWFSMNNFSVTDRSGRKEDTVAKILAIEVDRPTFVREFTETVDTDGKTVREYIGDWLPFANVSAAQVYTSAQISNSIRETNTYRKFSIVQEKSVARAKNPEIEFA